MFTDYLLCRVILILANFCLIASFICKIIFDHASSTSQRTGVNNFTLNYNYKKIVTTMVTIIIR